MKLDRADWVFDERMMRAVFAAVATLLALAALATRQTDEVDYSLLGPTIAAYWVWVRFGGIPRYVVYFLGLTTPLVLNIVESDSEVSMFLVVLTAAIVSSYEKNRTVVWSILSFTLVSIFVLGVTAIDSFAWPNWVFGTAFSWGFGSIVYRYVVTVDELGHARTMVADQAAIQERRRIARDVHDLVGHSLSVVMLHVTGARHLVHKDPAEAERALAQAEAAGHEALAEIRRTVGMLRDDADASQVALPSPELSDVPALVDEYLLGGVEISLDVDGDLGAVESAPALAGYRIVQEALSNIARHAIGARVLVELSVDEHSYDLVVSNTAGVTLDERPGSGFGLISMRERAKSVGGVLVAGPTSQGWRVEATLPVRPAHVLP